MDILSTRTEQRIGLSYSGGFRAYSSDVADLGVSTCRMAGAFIPGASGAYSAMEVVGVQLWTANRGEQNPLFHDGTDVEQFMEHQLSL